MRLKMLAIIAASAALTAAAAQAHHAFSTEFDAERPVALQGKVTKVELINPHSWIHIEVVDEAGVATVWMIEGGSPNALVRRGITKNSIPLGAELIVNGYQARDGSFKAVGRDLLFADGTALFFSGTEIPA
jgi:hypothetical protein